MQVCKTFKKYKQLNFYNFCYPKPSPSSQPEGIEAKMHKGVFGRYWIAEKITWRRAPPTGSPANINIITPSSYKQELRQHALGMLLSVERERWLSSAQPAPSLDFAPLPYFPSGIRTLPALVVYLIKSISSLTQHLYSISFHLSQVTYSIVFYQRRSACLLAFKQTLNYKVIYSVF